MRMPNDVRDRLRDLLWSKADYLGWSALHDGERSKKYEQWTRDPEVGGILAHYMDPRKVRVYIKDSLLKPYERARLSDSEHQILQRLGIPASAEVAQRYIKPHGIRFADGKIVSWGNSRDWKLIAMAMYERGATTSEALPFGMVLIETGATGKTATRTVVRGAADRLGIQSLKWID